MEIEGAHKACHALHAEQAASSPKAAAAGEAGGAGADLAADKAPRLSEAIPEWPSESVGASAPYTQRTFSRGCKYPDKCVPQPVNTVLRTGVLRDHGVVPPLHLLVEGLPRDPKGCDVW